MIQSLVWPWCFNVHRFFSLVLTKEWFQCRNFLVYVNPQSFACHCHDFDGFICKFFYNFVFFIIRSLVGFVCMCERQKKYINPSIFTQNLQMNLNQVKMKGFSSLTFLQVRYTRTHILSQHVRIKIVENWWLEK